MVDLKKGSDTRKMVGSFTQKLVSLPKDIVDEFYKKSKTIV